MQSVLDILILATMYNVTANTLTGKIIKCVRDSANIYTDKL